MILKAARKYELKHLPEDEGKVIVLVTKMPATAYAKIGRDLEPALARGAKLLAKAALDNGIDPTQLKGMDENDPRLYKMLLEVEVDPETIATQFDQLKGIDKLCTEYIVGWEGIEDQESGELEFNPKNLALVVADLPVSTKRDLVSALIALTKNGEFPGEVKSSSNSTAS